MRYMITGGCGFLGSNIAYELLKQNEEVFIFDNLYRVGAKENLTWLESIGNFKFIHSDIRNINDVERTIRDIKPDVIFHLAGQVAMTTSILDPRMDFEVNLLGSFNLLNAVRLYSPESIVVYSSTNKVYGDLEQYTYRESDTRYICVEKPNGFDELTPLDFHSPYGCSKGSADQYMLDFYRIYGIRTLVFRHSSIYGGRQFATYDQGWVGWFVQKAIEIKKGLLTQPFTISGNGKQVRDLLYVSDCVNLYLKSVQKIDITKGQVFNIGGGIENSSSLLELFNFLEQELNIKMTYLQLPPRKSDQRVFVADIRKAKRLIGWEPSVDKFTGIRKVLSWLNENFHLWRHD